MRHDPTFVSPVPGGLSRHRSRSAMVMPEVVSAFVQQDVYSPPAPQGLRRQQFFAAPPYAQEPGYGPLSAPSSGALLGDVAGREASVISVGSVARNRAASQSAVSPIDIGRH